MMNNDGTMTKTEDAKTFSVASVLVIHLHHSSSSFIIHHSSLTLTPT